MLAGDIIAELGEALGLANQTALLTRINRAVELLTVKRLFNSVTGTLNFSLNGLGNNIALPREVQTVLAVNINGSPSISRSRIYEFDLNTNGSVTGDSVEFEWNDRCNVPVQDERNYPGQLTYVCSGSNDSGSTLTAYGKDVNGREISETIIASTSSPAASANTFYVIDRIIRDATSATCTLYCNGVLTGQYYGDETEPNYRSIRLSQSVSSVRILFRRKPVKVTTLESWIPLESAMAVIQAAKAVGHFINGEDDLGDACLARAAQFITEDEASRTEGDAMAAARQKPGTLAPGFIHSEGITVLDVYDTACDIFGAVGRPTILKRITQAVQALIHKAHWDDMLGVVDIYPASQRNDINIYGKPGHAYYILPRFIGRPLKINLASFPMLPRNRWFDFNVNGRGERPWANWHHWDEMGDSALSNLIPREAVTGHLIPTQFIAICANSLDAGSKIKIYGREMVNGQEIEVWRNGEKGWCCPCVTSVQDPGSDAPFWTVVDKIERAPTRGFVRMVNPIPGAITPAVPAQYTLSTTDGRVTASGTFTGTNQTYTVWASVQFGTDGGGAYQRLVIFSDSGMTNSVYDSGNVHSPTGIFNATYTVNGTVFVGTITAAQDVSNYSLQIIATFSPAIPQTQAFSEGEQYGFWYPDEIEPRYAVIRLPTYDAKRIKVWYRKRFDALLSIYEPIPLRSVLAVEDMLRALKAHELGLVANAEPLEQKAVQYLSETRIKEGESENADMEVDPYTSPTVQHNFT